MTDLRALADREQHSRGKKRPPQNPSPAMPWPMRTRRRPPAASKMRSSDTVVGALQSVLDDAWTQPGIWLWVNGDVGAIRPIP
jgi:hypothetical protein